MSEAPRSFYIRLRVDQDKDYACLSASYSAINGETWERGHDMRDGPRDAVFAELRELLDYLDRYPLKTPHDFRYGPEALRNPQDQ